VWCYRFIRLHFSGETVVWNFGACTGCRASALRAVISRRPNLEQESVLIEANTQLPAASIQYPKCCFATFTGSRCEICRLGFLCTEPCPNISASWRNDPAQRPATFHLCMQLSFLLHGMIMRPAPCKPSIAHCCTFGVAISEELISPLIRDVLVRPAVAPLRLQCSAAGFIP
jgi:hypothetical protein